MKRIVLLFASFAAIAAFGVVAGRAITGPFNDLVARDFDTPVRHFVERPRDRFWHDLFSHLSVLGTALVTGAIAAVVGATWSIRRRSLDVALQLALAFAGVAGLTIIVKIGVNRYPVSGPIPVHAPGTFPSGHGLFAVGVYGMIGSLIMRSSAPRLARGLAAAALAVLAVTVGLSRVYLLDHYASDVVASIVLGVTWVAVVAFCVKTST